MESYGVEPRGSALDPSCLFRLKSVSDSGVGEDVTRSFPGLDLFSKLIDKHPEILRLLHALSAPHCVEQSPVSQHLVGFARHVGQKVELFWGEMDLFAADRDDPLLPIDAKISTLNPPR